MSIAQNENRDSGIRDSGAQLAPARAKLAHLTAALLSLQEALPKAAGSICQILVAELDCLAARLWLFNPYFGEFDLLGQFCDRQYSAAFEVKKNRLPLDFSTAGKSFKEETVERVVNSLASLLSIQDPERIPRRSANGAPSCLVSVPIVPFARGDVQHPIGVLNLFLRDEERSFDLLDSSSDEDLSFLASIVAAALARADEFGRGRVLARLNQLASSLVAPDANVSFEESRERYFHEVQRTVLDALHANCMSMFTSNASFDTIRCVCTTGMEGRNDKAFYRAEDLAGIFYRAGDGITWKVFETGQTVNTRNVRSLAGYRGKFQEQRAIGPTHESDPFLAVPLPGETHATGVIRVLERRCHVNPSLLQNFSRYDEGTLGLIAEQLSPVLRLLSLHQTRDIYVMRTTHQVIQPITGIIAYVSNILDQDYGPVPQVVEQKLRYVRAMARTSARVMRSSSWVTELRDFKFLLSLQRTRLPLTTYFLERIIDLQPLRRDEGILVQLADTKQADTLGDFWADELYFEQVVQNIIHNSVKYSYPNNVVEVRLERGAGAELRVEVSSTGLPILSTESERIFFDRERGHHAHAYEPNGTGQGLYISRRIMEGFGGQIQLVSSQRVPNARPPRSDLPPPHLTKFRVVLPRAFQ